MVVKTAKQETKKGPEDTEFKSSGSRAQVEGAQEMETPQINNTQMQQTL